MTKIAQIAISVYVMCIVAAFGAATVDSENAEYKHDLTCEPKPDCTYYGPNARDGFFKALVWPLWLSYKAAELLIEREGVVNELP